MIFAIFFGAFVGLAFAGFLLMPFFLALLSMVVCLGLAKLSLDQMGRVVERKARRWYRTPY